MVAHGRDSVHHRCMQGLACAGVVRSTSWQKRIMDGGWKVATVTIMIETS